MVARRSKSLCNNRICTPSLTAKLYLFCNRRRQCSPLAPSPQPHTICCTYTNNFISIRLWNFYKCLPAWLEYRISVSVRIVFWQRPNCETFRHHKQIYVFWILLYFTPQLNPLTSVLGKCRSTQNVLSFLAECNTMNIVLIHSFSILSDDRSKASSKTMPPYSAMQSLLLQMRISSPVLKVIQ